MLHRNVLDLNKTAEVYSLKKVVNSFWAKRIMYFVVTYLCMVQLGVGHKTKSLLVYEIPNPDNHCQQSLTVEQFEPINKGY